MLLLLGRFGLSQTIIPEAKGHFLTPSAHRHNHLFGGLGLRRREIENYLWDKAVVRKALTNMGAENSVVDGVINAYPFQDAESDDMKLDDRQQAFFELIRKIDGVSLPGRNRREFMSAHLAPALRETPGVFDELLEDVFGTGGG